MKKIFNSQKNRILMVLLGVCILGASAFFILNSRTHAHQRFFITGNLMLKLRSCGCSLRDLGGADRRFAYLQSIRQGSDLLIDYGAAYTEEIPKENDAKEISRFKLFSSVMNRFRYDEIHTLSSDNKVLNLLNERANNLLSSSDSGVSDVSIIEKNSQKFAFLGVSQKVELSLSALKEKISKVPLNIPLIVFSYLSISESTLLTKHLTVIRPVLVIGNDVILERYYSEKIADSLYVTGGDRGRFLTVLDVGFVYNFLGNLTDINEIKSDFVSVAKYHETLPEFKAMSDLITEWEEKNGTIDDFNH